jgi:two-component system sensor histidine kinase TctE
MLAKRSGRLSLRGKVLAVVLPGMLAIIGLELWLTRLDAIDAANIAFDRSLLGTVRSVDLNVSATGTGGLAVELPYRLFEFFQLTARGNVYFRVATADGLVEIGSPDLPLPDDKPPLGTAVFYDAVYFGEPVRVAMYSRTLDEPLSAGGVQQLVIQVAESVTSRQAFSRSFVFRAAARDAIVLSLIGITIAVLLTVTLRPVSRLAAQVRARSPLDMQPIGAQDLPRDIQPLVDAVNQQLARTQDLVLRQRQFVDDASHQLRTPLATLHAQLGYALRQKDPSELAATLQSISEQLESATRTTNQLLAMARTDAMPMSVEAIDLGELVRDVATRILPQLRGRNMDFGIDVPAVPCFCEGDRLLLSEALTNLAHNAITYAEPGDPVTVSAFCDASQAVVRVFNCGPPIPSHVAAHLGERFLKGASSKGAGLGLAIVKSIVERHHGSIGLERDEERQTNCIVLCWPCKFSPLQQYR